MVEGGWGWDAMTGDEEDGEESAEDDEGCAVQRATSLVEAACPSVLSDGECWPPEISPRRRPSA
jgi:hypothetical protein